MILGRIRSAPISIEAVEAIRTAAAATSLAILASGLTSGLTISTIDSSEVLISSRIRTDAIVMTKIAHSVGVNLNISPRTTAETPARIWMRKFLPFLNSVAIP